MFRSEAKFTGRLFRKYSMLIILTVSFALLANSALDGWFAYKENRESLLHIQHSQAEIAATKIGAFIQQIVNQIRWTTQLPLSKNLLSQRQFDAVRLLRQVPAITELSQIDATGHEQLRVSRVALDVIGSQIDFSNDPRFAETVSHGIYYGPIYFRRKSEPYMTLAVGGARRDAGVSVAEVNLKLIWDVISQIKVGKRGYAYVVDHTGRLIAHPDISLVLRNIDFASFDQVRSAIFDKGHDNGDFGRIGTNILKQSVLSAYAPIAQLGWVVFVELPYEEAYAPLYGSIQRSGVLLLLGLLLAFMVSIFFARRMVVPIRLLQAGVAKIGAGELGYQVDIRTGDEVEALANQFNTMSVDLRDAKAKEERFGRLRRFLTAQIANVIESTGSEEMLASHRREVSVMFCDLRGFTAFAEATEPPEVMRILGEYHQELGALIEKYEGTLERFIGDGLMVLFNDPLPCDDPALRAVRMSIEMRDCMKGLTKQWRAEGFELGFGIGIAHGDATLGQIGFEGRLDYSAIGRVPNLAARLCSFAKDQQILIDPNVRRLIEELFDCEDVGEITLKGIRYPLKTANVIGGRSGDNRIATQ